MPKKVTAGRPVAAKSAGSAVVDAERKPSKAEKHWEETTLASTLGTAGLRRMTAQAAAVTPTATMASTTICRRSFFFRISGRAMSIA